MSYAMAVSNCDFLFLYSKQSSENNCAKCGLSNVINWFNAIVISFFTHGYF